MSSLISISPDGPLMHLHRDTKTVEQLESGLSPGSVFHSDLPYVFVREQFELDSYSVWAGGRKFALPQALREFREANFDLAYLLVMTDEAGNSWVHDPTLYVTGMDNITDGTKICAALNGMDYQVAYTDNDSQLSALTKNSFRPTVNLTFRTWDTNDTSVTVFRTPFRNCRSHLDMWWKPGANYTVYNYMTGNLQSVNNDIAKVKFVFLNVEHSIGNFDVQKIDRSSREISLSPERFDVGGLDLEKFSPLVSHGLKTAGNNVHLAGEGTLVSGKSLGAGYATTKVSASGVVAGGASAVLEIPDIVSASGAAWEIDLHTQQIKRNNRLLFNRETAARAMFRLGSKQITFNTSAGLNGSFSTHGVNTTQSGNLGNVTANTLFLASIYSGDDRLHSTSIMSVGDNLVMYNCLGVFRRYIKGAYYSWSSNFWFTLRISASGVCNVLFSQEPGIKISNPGAGDAGNVVNDWLYISGVSFSLPDIRVRLIALGSLE